MSNERFCIGCAYYRSTHQVKLTTGCAPDEPELLATMCAHPETDLVTGAIRPVDLPCYDERSYRNTRPGGCGPEGKNWLAAQK
jgi:hypothetical protein